MINTINPEFTRQALQKKYGDPNSLTYLQPVPVFLTWNAKNASSYPDYGLVNIPSNNYNMYVGLLTMVTDWTNLSGSYTWTLQTTDTTNVVTTSKYTGNSANNTSIGPAIAPFQSITAFNKFSITQQVSNGAGVFCFYGFFYQSQ
jgi:hypothetical protein